MVNNLISKPQDLSYLAVMGLHTLECGSKLYLIITVPQALSQQKDIDVLDARCVLVKEVTNIQNQITTITAVVSNNVTSIDANYDDNDSINSNISLDVQFEPIGVI